jgi:nucleoid-associated protein YgaU
MAAPKAVEPRTKAEPRAVEPRTTSSETVTVAGTVLVERGDSLWKLAERTIGRGSQWRDLLAANPQIADPDKIVVGTRLNLPARGINSDSATKITVQTGDTLSKIAEARYGRIGAWRCLAQANPQIGDPNRIYEGNELLLPASCQP